MQLCEETGTQIKAQISWVHIWKWKPQATEKSSLVLNYYQAFTRVMIYKHSFATLCYSRASNTHSVLPVFPLPAFWNDAFRGSCLKIKQKTTQTFTWNEQMSQGDDAALICLHQHSSPWGETPGLYPNTGVGIWSSNFQGAANIPFSRLLWIHFLWPGGGVGSESVQLAQHAHQMSA